MGRKAFSVVSNEPPIHRKHVHINTCLRCRSIKHFWSTYLTHAERQVSRPFVWVCVCVCGRLFWDKSRLLPTLTEPHTSAAHVEKEVGCNYGSTGAQTLRQCLTFVLAINHQGWNAPINNSRVWLWSNICNYIPIWGSNDIRQFVCFRPLSELA